jgi:hypothetical protein
MSDERLANQIIQTPSAPLSLARDLRDLKDFRDFRDLDSQSARPFSLKAQKPRRGVNKKTNKQTI